MVTIQGATGPRRQLERVPGALPDSLARFQQVKLAFLRPPRQRAKARFIHVDAHIEWAQRLLGLSVRYRIQQVTHGPMHLDDMPQRLIAVDSVAVLTAFPCAGDVTRLFELGDDALDGALGDTNPISDVAQSVFRILSQANKHVSVIAQECPPYPGV
jgi:hypothetical protein